MPTMRGGDILKSTTPTAMHVMNRLFRAAGILALALLALDAHAGSNALPAEAEQALHSGGRIILYSLEPWGDPDQKVPRLDNYEILGKSALNSAQASSAIAAFDAAIAGFDGAVASCFDPRHAIRIQWKGHTYDFLLCYSCHLLTVYRDHQELIEIGAAGSPKELDGLLTSLHIPLSHSLEDTEAGQQEEREKAAEGQKR